jgi:hypothetical protein
VAGDWRKQHNEELHNLYFSPSIMEWIAMAQDRDQWRAFANTVLNLRVPENAGKFLSGCTIGGFSRRAQLRG